MKKYISPSYERLDLETKDIMQASSIVKEEKDEANDKIDFIISPDSIFGF